MTQIGLDTSVAVPLIVATHEHHADVTRWWAGRTVALSGHALAETYSVLTRLPGDMRHAPADASRLIAERFAAPLLLCPDVARRLPEILAGHQITGGAVYDALVGLAAVGNGAELASRDQRARATYEAVGARVIVAA